MEASATAAEALSRSLVHPPSADPASSPTVEPRSLAATRSHTYARACTRTVTVRATDDDGGVSPARGRTVVVLGTSTTRHPRAWWSSEYRGLAASLTAADRTCLLSTARTLSTVFPEQRALTTAADAVAVLRPTAPATARSTFDSHLLAVWLDVASGAVDPFAPFDADGDGSPETTVGDLPPHRRGHPQRVILTAAPSRRSRRCWPGSRRPADQLRRRPPRHARRG